MRIIPVAQLRRSVVQVYFASAGRSYAYYNDRFDLEAGDVVYVEGKLEGERGRVTEVNYSFKIKLSDYKKVIAVVDTQVNGRLHFCGSYLIAFGRETIPYQKVKSWFIPPHDEQDFVSGDDSSRSFSLSELSKMDIDRKIMERGYDYYIEDKIEYISFDGTKVIAVVEGCENYEVEFNYSDGNITNIKCTCFCCNTCKHEYAVLLLLKSILNFISENYQSEYDGYFAAIGKWTLLETVLDRKGKGKVSFEV